ncbi:MAG: hypothetical protein DWQ01_18435 [Planctomycetota bacterium]|nr:MAG: hypothetical protein DWQ01_18435 [Planctomycetota bacterium]
MHQRICLGGVPILIFHSVRKRRLFDLGVGGDLTMPSSVFERQMRSLRRGGYQSIRCRDLADHLEHGAPLPKRPVLITFDDGYLDNFTIAAPILRRHGLKATVFVATDFIHPEPVVRPTLANENNPPERGYMSKEELLALEQDGVFEVQCHTASHQRLPVSGEVEDFHRPDQPCQWMVRNAAPEKKPLEELEDLAPNLPWGTPVLQSEWLGAAHGFFPAPGCFDSLIRHVAENGGETFFQRKDWRASLLEKLAELGPIPGERESEEERERRLVKDLKHGRRVLEDLLQRPVEFLAWPGGPVDPQAVQVATETVGFRSTFMVDQPCPGVEPNLRVMNRCYFNQDYQGRFRDWVRVMKIRGVTDFESGRWLGYWRIFLANRFMKGYGDQGNEA